MSLNNKSKFDLFDNEDDANLMNDYKRTTRNNELSVPDKNEKGGAREKKNDASNKKQKGGV